MVVQDIFVRFRTNAREFTKQMLMPQQAFRNLYNNAGQLRKQFTKNVSAGQRLAMRFRHLTAGARGFRMEMLSVMFGAQMVSKALWGLLKPAMEVTGIFELFTAMLQILFLPVALWLLKNVFLPLFDIFTALPPPIQKAIGFFVLFAAVLFSILAVGASLVLFLGGLSIAFAELAPILTLLGTFFTWVAGGATTFGGILVQVFSKIAAAFVFVWGLFRIFMGWLEKDWWKVVSGVLLAVAGIIALILGGWIPAAIALVIAGLIWLGDKFKWVAGVIMIIMSPVVTMFTILYDTVKAVIDLISGKGFSGFKKVGETAMSYFGAIKNKFTGSRQTGGYVPHDGLYKLHAGETVQQSNTSNFSPNVVVNASSNVDIDMLKSQLSDQWSEELDRLSRR